VLEVFVIESNEGKDERVVATPQTTCKSKNIPKERKKRARIEKGSITKSPI